MATLPPRKNPTPTKISKQFLTPLQILLQMGFPKHRAEKALAATGNRGVQLASDWLLAHVNDPSLDECTPREYILYACPTGSFLQQLQEFWSKSKELCGWNGAHNFTPHITLVSFFKAPDECAPQLSKALKQVIEMAGTLIERPLQLELYTSANFMGFFVTEDDANFLKRLALQYVKEVSNSIISDTYEQLDALVACFPWCGGVTSGARCIPRSSRSISLEPHVKSLHLTLAYQFPGAQFSSLKDLVEALDPSCATSWELRLYSRDPRLATKQVHKVLNPHTPREPDELELRIGDYMYLNSDALKNSTDGWVEGISWLTGNIGYLPENYTEHTAESDAWTMHRTVQLCKSPTPSINSTDEIDSLVMEKHASTDGKSNNKIIVGNVSDKEVSKPSPSHINTMHEQNCSIESVVSSDINDLSEADQLANDDIVKFLKEIRSSKSKLSTDVQIITDHCIKKSDSSKHNRKLFVMRHGERIDITFGSWVPFCFDEKCSYIRKDLNLPKSLPQRKTQSLGWQKDSPITMVGYHQAHLIGDALKQAGVIIDHVFCSPSYRCIETGNGVLEGLGCKEKIPICIEPGLFEWLAWYPDGYPDWVSKCELKIANFNIKMDYENSLTAEQLFSNTQETCEDFYLRNHNATKTILEKTDGNVLIVAHAATLETSTRLLLERPTRSIAELSRLLQKIGYCSMSALEYDQEKWKMIPPPCYPITQTANPRFEWKVLNS